MVKSANFKKNKIFLYCFAYMYLYMPHMYSALKGWKKVSDPLNWSYR